MKKEFKKGFTLIELLFATTIISILAGLGIYNMSDSTDLAKKTALKMELSSICKSQEFYFKDNLSYASSLAELDFKTAFEENEISYVIKTHKCSNNLNFYKVEAKLLLLEKNNQLFLDGCTCLISENDVVEPEIVVVPEPEPEVVVPVEPEPEVVVPVEPEPEVVVPVEPEPEVVVPVEPEPEVVVPVEPEPEVVVPVEPEPEVVVPVEPEPEVVVPVEPEPEVVVSVEDIKTIEDYIAGNYSSETKFDFLYCPDENYVSYQGLKYCFKNYVAKSTLEGNLIAMVYQDVNISIPLEIATEIIKLNSIKLLTATDSDSLSALTSLKEIKSIINVDINSNAARSVLNNLTYIEEIFLTNVPSTYNWRDTIPKETIRLDKNSYICLNFSKLKVKVRTTPTSSRTVSYTEICES